MIVIVDSREPSWVKSLGFGDSRKTISTLPFGDIQVIRDDGIILIIERKTSSDLLSSIADGRLFNQCAGIGNMISEASTNEKEGRILGILLISGGLHPIKGKTHTDKETGWNWASVQGALLTAQNLGMKILHIESEYELEKWVMNLAEKDFIGDYYLQPDKTLSKISTTVSLLSQLPGIGLEKAMMLSGHTGDNFIQSLRILLDPDKKVKGVGEKTTQAIRKALGIEENQILAILDNIDGMEAMKGIKKP